MRKFAEQQRERGRMREEGCVLKKGWNGKYVKRLCHGFSVDRRDIGCPYLPLPMMKDSFGVETGMARHNQSYRSERGLSRVI